MPKGLGDIQSQIADTANRYGVPVEIALGVAKTETNFDQSKIGGKGEIGMFQLMPSTAKELGVDPYDLTGNIEGGVSYLAKMFARFGDWSKAILAYNAGAGNLAKGIYNSSYLTKVTNNGQEFVGFGGSGTPTDTNTEVIAENGDVMPTSISDMGKVILGIVGVGLVTWIGSRFV